ncbi:MAG: gluconate 2-dehydrogenase subunit 3 family protein [Niabella sp.]
MKRRIAIRYLFITGGAVWLFPQCIGKGGASGESFLSEQELSLLADIADTIIPSTTTPGAKELGVQHFIHKMVTDCRSADYQQAFKAGLKAFESTVKANSGKAWSRQNSLEKEQTLKSIASDSVADKNVKTCIKGIRELTITGYRHSEYYVTKVQKYNMIPGHYNGCVKVNEAV